MLRLILIAAFTLGATQSIAQTRLAYICEATNVSRQGFRSMEAAREWFPPQVGYVIQGNEATSTLYGAGRVTRQGNKLNINFPAGPHRISVSINVKTGRYEARVGAWANQLRVRGARGTCTPAKA